METLHHKLLTIRGQQGFSLIEIVVALVILSTSILVLYNLILSTNLSIFHLDDHYPVSYTHLTLPTILLV